MVYVSPGFSATWRTSPGMAMPRASTPPLPADLTSVDLGGTPGELMPVDAFIVLVDGVAEEAPLDAAEALGPENIDQKPPPAMDLALFFAAPAFVPAFAFSVSCGGTAVLPVYLTRNAFSPPNMRPNNELASWIATSPRSTLPRMYNIEPAVVMISSPGSSLTRMCRDPGTPTISTLLSNPAYLPTVFPPPRLPEEEDNLTIDLLEITPDVFVT